MLNSAIAAFIVEVVAKHGEPAKRLCNKDPFTMKSAVYLSELFPRAKFLLMVRDGRATVHSIITRKVFTLFCCMLLTVYFIIKYGRESGFFNVYIFV